MVLRILIGVAFALILGAMVGLTIILVIGIGGFIWDQHPWLLGPLVVAGGLASAIALRHGRHSRPSVGTDGPAVHPGITMHSIPVAGGMGLVFTIGYLAMFWFGLPGVRPVVLGLGALGVIVGAMLAFRNERRSRTEQDTKVLHLEKGEGSS